MVQAAQRLSYLLEYSSDVSADDEGEMMSNDAQYD
jgi:hypothetical protein